LSVDVPDGLIIDGYPGSYGQILTNLFLNAANHAFAGGRSGSISISARPRGQDDVEIIFADNGAGMTPDVQRQAFDPFFTTRRNEGGTGLGLHIVYNLDDVLHLIDDTEPASEDTEARKWKIAVIDDDPAVHDGTRFALSDYCLNGQRLEILSAYSAAEGRKLMAAHGDIAA
ncbi:hypothetical protein KXV85_002403, partial [Aspergillus fumigatus]